MSICHARLLPNSREVQLLVLDPYNEPLLKDRLPSNPAHPRAAITLLEGLALWAGHRLSVAVAVTANSTGLIEELLPQGPAWCSPLVELMPVDGPSRRRRVRRLDGLGDFQAVYQLRLPGLSA